MPPNIKKPTASIVKDIHMLMWAIKEWPKILGQVMQINSSRSHNKAAMAQTNEMKTEEKKNRKNRHQLIFKTTNSAQIQHQYFGKTKREEKVFRNLQLFVCSKMSLLCLCVLCSVWRLRMQQQFKETTPSWLSIKVTSLFWQIKRETSIRNFENSFVPNFPLVRFSAG